MEKKYIFCYNCGQKLPANANFCVKCGFKQNVCIINDESESTNEGIDCEEVSYVINNNPETVKPKNQINAKFVINIISRSLLLLLSIIMFSFTFLPNIEATFKDEVILNINSYDSITFLFDSFKEISAEDIKDTNLYAELEELDEEFDLSMQYEEFSQLTKKEKEKVRQMIYLTLRLALQSEDAFTTVDLTISAIASFTYIIFTISFFVISLLNLLGLFVDKLSKLNKANIILLSLVPMVLLVTYFSYCSFISDSFPVRMSGGLTTPLIISCIIILYYSIMSFIKKENVIKAKELVCLSVKLTLTIVTVCLLFTPFFESHVTANYYGSSHKREAIIYSDVFKFYNFEYSDNELEQYDKWSEFDENEAKNYYKLLMSVFEEIKYLDAKDAEGQVANTQVLLYGYALSDSYEFGEMFILIPILCLAALALLGIILQQIILRFILGKSCKLLINISAVSQAILVAVAFAFTLTFAIIFQNYAFDLFNLNGYEIKISAGIIILLIVSLSVIFIPTTFKRKEQIEYIVE